MGRGRKPIKFSGTVAVSAEFSSFKGEGRIKSCSFLKKLNVYIMQRIACTYKKIKINEL